MAVVIKGQANLHGLQHAEQQSILAYFMGFFAKGTITITGFAAAGATSLTVFFTGPGGGGQRGSEVFSVPGPEIGSGISFAVVATLVGLYALHRKRSPVV